MTELHDLLHGSQEDFAEAYNAWAEDYPDAKLARVWPDPKLLADELARLYPEEAFDWLALISRNALLVPGNAIQTMVKIATNIRDRLHAAYTEEATQEKYYEYLRHERAKLED